MGEPRNEWKGKPVTLLGNIAHKATSEVMMASAGMKKFCENPIIRRRRKKKGK